jgi:hypothetical protein
MEDNKTVIDMDTTGTKEEALKRKLNVIKNIVLESGTVMLEDKRIYQAAAGIGLWQGLKYRGSFKQGLKAGIATIGVMAGANIIYNIVQSSDEIKNA